MKKLLQLIALTSEFKRCRIQTLHFVGQVSEKPLGILRLS